MLLLSEGCEGNLSHALLLASSTLSSVLPVSSHHLPSMCVSVQISHFYKDTVSYIGLQATVILINSSYLFLKKILFIFRERGSEREREGEKHWCARDTSIGCLLHAPNWGPSPQPKHVPWLGIEPMTFWFSSWHSVHWVTPVRATSSYLDHPQRPYFQIKSHL